MENPFENYTPNLFPRLFKAAQLIGKFFTHCALTADPYHSTHYESPLDQPLELSPGWPPATPWPKEEV